MTKYTDAPMFVLFEDRERAEKIKEK